MVSELEKYLELAKADPSAAPAKSIVTQLRQTGNLPNEESWKKKHLLLYGARQLLWWYDRRRLGTRDGWPAIPAFRFERRVLSYTPRIYPRRYFS